MRFENIYYLYLFALIPVLIIFYIWRSKVRQRDMEKLASSPLLNHLLANFSPFERKLRFGLLLSGVFFLILALLGPQWGFTWETFTHRGVDVIVAVDTSKSMLAEDARPNRLERGKLIIQDLIEEGDRIGLITFAGTSFLQVPLTIDYNAFMQGVEFISPEVMPQGGTAIGEAMETALNAFENVTTGNKVLVLITDGENHSGDPVQIAEKVAKTGVKLMVIGMGTTEGELIPVVENGHRQFLKDSQGNVVKTRLEESLLKDIASRAGGAYISGNDLSLLDSIYSKFIGQMKKNEYTTTRKKNYHHRYQIFLFIGITLLCIEMFIGIKKEVRS